MGLALTKDTSSCSEPRDEPALRVLQIQRSSSCCCRPQSGCASRPSLCACVVDQTCCRPTRCTAATPTMYERFFSHIGSGCSGKSAGVVQKKVGVAHRPTHAIDVLSSRKKTLLSYRFECLFYELQPVLEILKALVIGDVVHKDDRLRAANVIGKHLGADALPTNVPNVQAHLDIACDSCA